MYATLLTPKGKFLHDAIFYRHPGKPGFPANLGSSCTLLAWPEASAVMQNPPVQSLRTRY